MAQACAGKRKRSEVAGKLAYYDAILSPLRALLENRGEREVIEFPRAMDAGKRAERTFHRLSRKTCSRKNRLTC